MLYPENTSTRVCVSLDGIWSFALLFDRAAYNPAVPLMAGHPMPVPCAYNDIHEGREIRDHVGFVAYERTFEAPQALRGGRLLLRFGSVAHKAEVFLNGALLGNHRGGFLPFAFDISDVVQTHNRLTVLADNIVDHSTLPCGTLQTRTFPELAPQVLNFPNFDYFNYSGILRPVVLYAVPSTYIDSVYVSGLPDGSFEYEITPSAPASAVVQVIDETGEICYQSTGLSGRGRIEGVVPWSPETPRLYRLRIALHGEDGAFDTYDERFGFREIAVRGSGLFLNDKPLYLKGFGKHEDVPVIGRGFVEAYNVKDLSLIKWMGGNSFRTSHYPYSEEMMRLCDQMGILVIDETPAVGMHTTFTATGMKIDTAQPTWEALHTQKHHREVLESLIARDQNHPCVIMWSIANEPASEEPGAHNYFAPLFELVRKLDKQQRPTTFATHGEATVETCEVAPLCDVIMLNRYYGWYSEEGNLPAARAVLSDELNRYHARYPDKPILLGEFGADAIAGLHDTTAQMFSEEFQRDTISAYCEVLDEKPYICGEHVWNFSDFATAESVKRVQGNKKGVFTRERKPKLAVWYLKRRWTNKD